LEVKPKARPSWMRFSFAFAFAFALVIVFVIVIVRHRPKATDRRVGSIAIDYAKVCCFLLPSYNVRLSFFSVVSVLSLIMLQKLDFSDPRMLQKLEIRKKPNSRGGEKPQKLKK